MPNIWGFPFNIYTMSEARDFKFGIKLEFAKAHHTITPQEKLGMASGYGSSPKFCSSTSIFTRWLKQARNFKFGTHLGFAKAHYKTTPRGKVGVAWLWVREASVYFNIYAMAALSSER